MLARALQHDVPHHTRVKGMQYARAGRVRAVTPTPHGVTAVVRGTQDYRVAIDHESGGFLAMCECPYFADRRDICKHIWAVVLSREAERALAAGGPIPRQAWIDPAHGDAPPASWPAGARGRSGATDAWRHFLTEVERGLAAADGAWPDLRARNGEIVYLVDVPASVAENAAVLCVLVRTRKRSGEWTRPRPSSTGVREIEQLAHDVDREILALLHGALVSWMQGAGPQSYQYHATRYTLRGVLEERILPLAARTGRLLLGPSGRDGEALPLAADEGEPWRFELSIGRTPAGFAVGGALVRDGARMDVAEPVLLLAGGFVFTRANVARLHVDGTWPWLVQLRRSGSVTVPPDAAGALVDTLARAGVEPGGLPEELRYEIVAAVPRPVIRIRRRPRESSYSREYLDADVQFDYGGLPVSGPGAAAFDAAARRLVRREPAAEGRFYDRLAELGFRKVWTPAEARQSLGIQADRFPPAVRALVREGWRVEAEGRLFRPPGNPSLEVKSGIDWFELHGRVDFGDGVSASLPQLLAALRRGDGTVMLDDGSRGLVPEDWLRRLAGLADFGETAGDHVRYRPSQAALLDALLAAQPAVAVDEAFGRARGALQSFDGIGPLDPPDTFRGRLREYQREALGWFAFLRRFGFGGCLADDMGLGKTVMVLAMLEARRRERPPGERVPSLAVVPKSLVFNWREEAEKFAPALRLLDYTGSARSTDLVHDHDLVLTTYGTLRRDAAMLTDIEFEYAILDEAQAIKNAGTASWKAARLLRSTHRLALSGTPVENHVGELWSLFEFLNPGIFGTAAAFGRSGAARAKPDPDEVAFLARAVRPFILRRTKRQVAPELPERHEQTIHCELDPAQRRHYDELRDHYRRTLLSHVDRHGLARSKMQVLEALLRLRQAACHPALVDPQRTAEPSAKVDVLLPMLAELVEEGHKALVFSQFTSFLGLLRPRLEAAGFEYEYLDGRTRDRAARVARFQSDPGCPLFLISLKAGGLGLNLTGAEYVFLLDPWWNPAAEAQAIDRAHRIGQARHVFAYRLIARDTVEEKVAALQQTKRDLADAILTADAGLVRTLTREDLAWLVG